VIDVAALDALKARADALWRGFTLPDDYQGYIEYHRARQTFERELSPAQWPAIRAAFANDQHLMMNDSERIPDHERTADRTDAAAEKAAA
jgi:hypothetical protein